jgi:hypothetical protein
LHSAPFRPSFGWGIYRWVRRGAAAADIRLRSSGRAGPQRLPHSPGGPQSGCLHRGSVFHGGEGGTVPQEILFGYLSDTPADTLEGIRPPGRPYRPRALRAAAAPRIGGEEGRAVGEDRPGWGRGGGRFGAPAGCGSQRRHVPSERRATPGTRPHRPAPAEEHGPCGRGTIPPGGWPRSAAWKALCLCRRC